MNNPDTTQLALLLKAQRKLDEAHNKQTIAQYGQTPVPSRVKHANVQAWREERRASAAAELGEAEAAMDAMREEFNVTPKAWLELRRAAIQKGLARLVDPSCRYFS
jgi:hypothetical protein